MTALVWTAGSVVPAGTVLALLRRMFAVVVVVGPSMEPAFHAGDRLLVRRAGLSRVRVGDVVVVRTPRWLRFGPSPLPPGGAWMVKRAAALPGDPLPASVAGTVPRERVAPGTVVVLGDNTAASVDSRHCGPVPGDGLLGVVLRRIGCPLPSPPGPGLRARPGDERTTPWNTPPSPATPCWPCSRRSCRSPPHG
ncbi:MAG: hypothetical protein HOY69_38460 [Streptomyces sp.]|nr:hypothetical protein [Streptomyces sp.]